MYNLEMDWIYVKLVLLDRETGKVQNNIERRQVVSLCKWISIQFFVKFAESAEAWQKTF